jgi:hypothetical protein
MKPYFAKYLPVEGEIKEGDLITGGNCIFVVPYDSSQYKIRSSDKKVKLFLCSRDIQVGDKVTGENGTVGKVSQTFGEDKVVSFNCDWEGDKPNNAFKVIGEISPNAKWVKEGDEFDEDQISPYECGSCIDCCNDCQFRDENGSIGGVFMMIKCPCCETFK